MPRHVAPRQRRDPRAQRLLRQPAEEGRQDARAARRRAAPHAQHRRCREQEEETHEKSVKPPDRVQRRHPGGGALHPRASLIDTLQQAQRQEQHGYLVQELARRRPRAVQQRAFAATASMARAARRHGVGAGARAQPAYPALETVFQNSYTHGTTAYLDSQKKTVGMRAGGRTADGRRKCGGALMLAEAAPGAAFDRL